MPTPNNSFGIANVIIPRGGPKTVPVILDFTGTDGTVEVDGSQLVQQNKIEYIQCLYVDNHDNPNPLIINTDLTQQRIVVPANSQGYYSILQPNPPKFIFETTIGAFTVPVQFLNVPVQPCVWGDTLGGGGGGGGGAVNPTGPTIDDYSIMSMSGASENVLAVGEAAHYLAIMSDAANPDVIMINLAGGDADTTGIPLSPGGSLTIENGVANAVTASDWGGGGAILYVFAG